MSQQLTDFKPGITPVGPRLVVFPTPIEEFTKGGIALPTQHTEREELKQVEAFVVSVGFEAFEDTIAPWCGPGDTILIAAFAGRMWTGADGKKYRIILDGDVMAVKDVEPDTSSCTDQRVDVEGIGSKEGFSHGN